MYQTAEPAVQADLLLCGLVGLCGPIRILIQWACGDRTVVGCCQQELSQRQWLEIIGHAPCESFGITVVGHIHNMRAMVLTDAAL